RGVLSHPRGQIDPRERKLGNLGRNHAPQLVPTSHLHAAPHVPENQVSRFGQGAEVRVLNDFLKRPLQDPLADLTVPEQLRLRKSDEVPDRRDPFRLAQPPHLRRQSAQAGERPLPNRCRYRLVQLVPRPGEAYTYVYLVPLGVDLGIQRSHDPLAESRTGLQIFPKLTLFFPSISLLPAVK